MIQDRKVKLYLLQKERKWWQRWVEGMGRIMDLGRGYAPHISFSFSPRTDLEALKEDWKVVGEDLAVACREFEAHVEHESERERR